MAELQQYLEEIHEKVRLGSVARSDRAAPICRSPQSDPLRRRRPDSLLAPIGLADGGVLAGIELADGRVLAGPIRRRERGSILTTDQSRSQVVEECNDMNRQTEKQRE
eukprot:540453-Prorocentrum_minimum.AAC.1